MNPFSHEPATGVPELDSAHEGLGYLLRRVFEPGVECRRHQDGSCDKRACTKITAILKYLHRNFAGEEHLMAKAGGYPGYASHLRHHSALVTSLAAMQRSCICAETDGTYIRDFIAKWGSTHMARCDRPLGSWAATAKRA
jgi:hemerythrin-like metal-binding protein